jgi:hypothetical protein
MPYGNFYYGKTGFFFKKSGATGARYNPSLGAICNQPQDVNNRFVPGSGVGASSTAQRRAKLIQAYRTVAQKDGKGPQHLGVFAQGGSNMYALNWGLYNSPYFSPGTPPTVSDTPGIYSIVTGYTQATVYWTAPNNGGSSITSYTIQYSTDGVTWTTTPNVSPTLTSYTITGLSNNQLYYFRILATNSVGNSGYSPVTTSLVQNFDSWDLVPDTDGYTTTIITSAFPTTKTDETSNTSVVIYRQKNYYSSASSVYSSGITTEFYSYLAFQYTNKINGPSPNYTYWNSARTYNGTGNYTGSQSTIIQGVGTVFGEWMQSQTEFSSAINSYYIQARYYTENARRLPSTWYIVGSNDNATWNLITSQTTPYTWTSSSGSYDGTFGDPNGLPFTNNVYTYIRIVVPTIFNPEATNPSGVDIWIFRPNALIQNLSPGSPTNLVQTGATSTSITLSFTPSVSYGGAITNYRYSINGGSTFTAFSPAQTTGPVTITGLTAGTSYNIVLRGANQYGAGTKSSTVSMTTPTLTSIITGLTDAFGMAFQNSGNYLFFSQTSPATISYFSNGVTTPFLPQSGVPDLTNIRTIVIDNVRSYLYYSLQTATLYRYNMIAFTTTSIPIGGPIQGITLDQNNNVYVVTDRSDQRLYKVIAGQTTSSVIYTSSIVLDSPVGITNDFAGNFYITNNRGGTSDCVSKISIDNLGNATGSIILQNSTPSYPFTNPVGIAYYNSYIYVANNGGTLIKFKTDGTDIATVFTSGQVTALKNVIVYNNALYMAGQFTIYKSTSIF